MTTRRKLASTANTDRKLARVLREVRACEVCLASLPLPPKPILSVSASTKILIVGQAPGRKVHEAGVPWQDKSGDTLCDWLGVTKEQFLDNRMFGTMPMGFCFPGNRPGGGDLPPRAECAPLWHQAILAQLRELRLTLIIGQYAMKTYLKSDLNLTESVRNFRDYLPTYFPLVHPSPLNFRWQTKNPWFVEDVVPELRRRVRELTR